MTQRRARAVQIALMVWLTMTFVTGWLPFLRSLMDGPSYEWGATLFGLSFSGAGLGGDYWFPVLKTAIGLSFLWLGWRAPNGAFRPLLVLWLALMFADTVHAVLTVPDNFRFQGDTLGMDFSLVLVAPALDGGMLLLALWFAARAPALEARPMGPANQLMLGMAILFLPLQFFLLRSGQGQEVNDVVGVLLTIAGWILLSAGLAPWRARRRSAAFHAT